MELDLDARPVVVLRLEQGPDLGAATRGLDSPGDVAKGGLVGPQLDADDVAGRLGLEGQPGSPAPIPFFLEVDGAEAAGMKPR